MKSTSIKPCELPCEKCGSSDVSRTFHKMGDQLPGEGYGNSGNRFTSGNTNYFQAYRDHLDHRCRVCGYRWQTLPMAKPKKAVKERG